MAEVLEIFADKNKIVERDFTPEEKAQRDIDASAYEASQAAETQKNSAIVAARSAAIAHAKSLGFTDEMISVMYPTLVEE